MILRSDSPGMLLINPLLQFDHWLFQQMNQVWTNPFFDRVMPFFGQQEFWYPMFLFFLVFAIYNFGLRGCWWVVSLIMTAIISDLFSSSLMKTLIFRLRPCQNPDIADQVRLLVNYCPGNSGFISAHACNHFAAAWFIFITLNETGSWRWLLFVWAFMICYSQIYIGLQYPLDIAGGAIPGSVIGYSMALFFRKQFGTLSLK